MPKTPDADKTAGSSSTVHEARELTATLDDVKVAEKHVEEKVYARIKKLCTVEFLVTLFQMRKKLVRCTLIIHRT